MRMLTDEDVAAIVAGIKESAGHTCRFEEIEEKDLKASVEFYKHFNSIMVESGSTLRKTILVLGVTGLVTIIGLGLVSKIKQVLP